MQRVIKALTIGVLSLLFVFLAYANYVTWQAVQEAREFNDKLERVTERLEQTLLNLKALRALRTKIGGSPIDASLNEMQNDAQKINEPWYRETMEGLILEQRRSANP